MNGWVRMDKAVLVTGKRYLTYNWRLDILNVAKYTEKKDLIDVWDNHIVWPDYIMEIVLPKREN